MCCHVVEQELIQKYGVSIETRNKNTVTERKQQVLNGHMSAYSAQKRPQIGYFELLDKCV